MATLPPAEKRVKVVAMFGRPDDPECREQTLVDQPLTLDTLALIQSASPLSRMFLDGAGLEKRPCGIAVYVDGKRLWYRDCPHYGATDAYSSTRKGGHDNVHAVPFTDAFGEDYDEEGRLADNRAAMEYLRNDYSDRDDAENWAADVVDAAGSHRPILRPTPAPPEHAPPADGVYDPHPAPIARPSSAAPKRERLTEDKLWHARYATRERTEWIRALEGTRYA